MSHSEICPICVGLGKLPDPDINKAGCWVNCHGCGGCGWIVIYDGAVPMPEIWDNKE